MTRSRIEGRRLKGVVLAGGLGTRLRSVVGDRPKVMAPMGDRPFLAVLLQMMSEQGFDEVILAVGYGADVIVEHFGDDFSGLSLRYSQETQPLGTGGAIRRALALAGEDPVFVLNGDTILEADYQDMLASHLESASPLTLGVVEVEDASRYGGISIRDGIITRMAEKSIAGRGLVNAGVYVMGADIFSGLDVAESFSFERDFLQPNLGRLRAHAYSVRGYFVDIGVPDDYEAARGRLTRK